MSNVSASDAPALVTRLFYEHASAIRRYFRRQLRETGAADDLSQEVFLRVVRGSRTYDPRERERAWIFRIARNVLVDHHRRRGRSAEISINADSAAPPAQATGLDLQQALATLPPEDRDVFLLGEVGGLTYAEIAAATGGTVAAVRSRIYRARLALRERLMPPARVADAAAYKRDDHD